ncbi:MAG TPA: hypothetical protein VG477_02635, partial [Thermoanaerobaculia bacterium]|nr:hypothetical protein [Thermoanaerobaculia bacterium]
VFTLPAARQGSGYYFSLSPEGDSNDEQKKLADAKEACYRTETPPECMNTRGFVWNGFAWVPR